MIINYNTTKTRKDDTKHRGDDLHADKLLDPDQKYRFAGSSGEGRSGTNECEKRDNARWLERWFEELDKGH